MKNPNAKHVETVISFLKTNPNSTVDTIREGTNLSDILLRGVFKTLQEEGAITANDEDGGYVFTGSTKKTETIEEEKKADKKVETKATAKTKTKDEDLGPATPSGRDYSKYDFNGMKGLTKGKLALAIIQKYVEDNPKATLTKMEELFDSKTIQPRYGVLEELTKAKKHTKNNRERYFLKPEEIIKITPKAAVTNQWSADTLKPLLAIAKKLGYKINVSK